MLYFEERGNTVITQIEIDVFKTFKDFKVELAPIQVIVGPNGSGKSNLFDALHLLSRLAEYDVQTAFQDLRGDASDQFTKYADGSRSEKIRFAVEMLVNRTVQNINGGDILLDSEGGIEAIDTFPVQSTNSSDNLADDSFELVREVVLEYTRLRYELEIIYRQEEAYISNPFQITHESLKSITGEDSWSKKYIPSSNNIYLQGMLEKPDIFIETRKRSLPKDIQKAKNREREINQQVIFLFPDGDKRSKIKGFQALELQRTILSSTNDIIYPHVLAVREELQALKFFHFHPEALRKPSPINTVPVLGADGSNLPTTLAYMQSSNKFALTDISRDMANLASGIFNIKVEKHVASNRYEVWGETTDGETFPAELLSDGTMRLLALATLRNDARLQGVLCIEEPDNGVYALHLEEMALILREMITDFNDPQQTQEPLRQVLMTAHSPLFVGQPGVRDSILFVLTPVRTVKGDEVSLHVTRMEPVITPDILSVKKSHPELVREKSLEAYTIDMARRYLNSDVLDETRQQLQDARTRLREGL